MTRSELILKISQAYKDLPQVKVEQLVEGIFSNISEALAKGGRVELRGFGTFSLRQREERLGRNPRTGDKVKVAKKAVPFFKSGKELRQLLNQ